MELENFVENMKGLFSFSFALRGQINTMELWGEGVGLGLGDDDDDGGGSGGGADLFWCVLPPGIFWCNMHWGPLL